MLGEVTLGKIFKIFYHNCNKKYLSGQQVLGPERSNIGEFINRVLESARNSGAQEVTSSDTQNSQTLLFAGSAHRLGGHGVNTEHIASEPLPEQPVYFFSNSLFFFRFTFTSIFGKMVLVLTMDH